MSHRGNRRYRWHRARCHRTPTAASHVVGRPSGWVRRSNRHPAGRRLPDVGRPADRCAAAGSAIGQPSRPAVPERYYGADRMPIKETPHSCIESHNANGVPPCTARRIAEVVISLATNSTARGSCNNGRRARAAGPTTEVPQNRIRHAGKVNRDSLHAAERNRLRSAPVHGPPTERARSAEPCVSGSHRRSSRRWLLGARRTAQRYSTRTPERRAPPAGSPGRRHRARSLRE